MKQYPDFLTKPKPSTPPPPTEAKLRLLLENGKHDESFIQLVADMIVKHNLPYVIENGELKDTLSRGEQLLKKFITVDSKMLAMKDNAKKMAKCDYEVLIHGETGTGKETLGQSMIGERSGQVKAVNCAGFPHELIESELFGHVKGSFTGADNTKEGLMSAAKDGVMFLDEIGELPLNVQAKLLRALQEKRIRKVGGNKEEEINCKFVCATNQNLKQMVNDGTFRKDLYARICTLELNVNPLRERLDDVEPICNSIPHGKEFFATYRESLLNGSIDLSLNVRSLLMYIRRHEVLGCIN